MNKTDIEPTEGNVLVELFEKATEIGGIIIPESDTANNAPVRGTIIRTNKQFGSPFNIGETIFFRKYAVDELKFSEEDLSEQTVMIIDESEILGVIRPLDKKDKKESEQDVRASTKEADDEQRKAINKK